MKTDDPILWQASDAFRESSRLTQFVQWLDEHRSLSFTDYNELYRWSVENVASFWGSLWEFFDIAHDGTVTDVLLGGPMPDNRWFEGTKLSYSEHIFRQASPERPALVFYDEGGDRTVSWDEMRHKTALVRSALKSAGVSKGDRVVAYMSNVPETLYCFLAANSLGAIWSCCSPDFGSETVIDRFAQVEPKVLIAANGYVYGNKVYDRREEVGAIREALQSVELSILFDGVGELTPQTGFVTWHQWLDGVAEEELEFERVEFSHPMWILYSSGTTGKPKAITHSHGGILLEHLKYMHFHNDVHEGENFFWFTTTGWMMWNFLQASLLAGATAVLFDGSPSKPDLMRLWKIAADLPIHHFGTSAPFLVACMKRGLSPAESLDLQSLRSIGSTGAPLPSEAFDWVYDHVGKHIWLCSMSGGTDVCTAFVGGQPWGDVRRGRISCRALGVDLEAIDETGATVRESLGEMVIRQAMPSMPIFFWGDEDGQRYRQSYFEKYPGIWRHGDWIQIYDDGSLVIHGRSDATLNRNGIRMGTAEIYRVLLQIEALQDALIINIEQPGGGDLMPLFVVLKDGHLLSDALIEQIKTTLRRDCSPRHVPDRILAVPDIPYTLSGKKMEVPVKRLFMPSVTSSVNMEAVRNPKAMEYFMQLNERGLD